MAHSDEHHDVRAVYFDPSRVEDFIDDLHILFDGARADRYDDQSKKASTTRCCSNPGLNRFVRGWMRHGVPTGGGAVVDWHAATSSQVKHTLRHTKHILNKIQRIFEAFVQNSRFDPHIVEYFQLKRCVGEAVDVESSSRKMTNDIVDTLSETTDPIAVKY